MKRQNSQSESNSKRQKLETIETQDNLGTQLHYYESMEENQKLDIESGERFFIDFSNFFELGGHSIIAVKIVVKIQKKTGTRIPLSAVFQNPTIEKFAKLLNKPI